MRRRQGSAEVMSGNSETGFSVEDVQNGWHVQAWVELRDGAPRITELRLRSAEGSTLDQAHGPEGPQPNYPFRAGRRVPAGGITSPVLRGIAFTPIFDAIGRNNASAGTLALHGFDPDQDFLASRRPGRKGRDSRFYAVWAERYIAECEKTRRPYPVMAAEYGYPPETIRDFVSEAKTRGLIVGRTPGRAGGRLSAKAKRLLETGDTS